MSLAMLFAMSLPGLVVLLIAVAALERIVHRHGGRSASAAGLDVFSASMLPGRAVELEHRDAAKTRRATHTDGAPPHGVDLAGGTAHVRVD